MEEIEHVALEVLSQSNKLQAVEAAASGELLKKLFILVLTYWLFPRRSLQLGNVGISKHSIFVARTKAFNSDQTEHLKKDSMGQVQGV